VSPLSKLTYDIVSVGRAGKRKTDEELAEIDRYATDSGINIWQPAQG
jgi:hypothetical protein